MNKNKHFYATYGSVVAFLWMLAAFFVLGLWGYLNFISFPTVSALTTGSIDASFYSHQNRYDSQLASKISSSTDTDAVEPLSRDNFAVGNVPELTQRLVSIYDWDDTSSFSSSQIAQSDGLSSGVSPANYYGLYLGQHHEIDSLRSEWRQVKETVFGSSIRLESHAIPPFGAGGLWQLVAGPISDVRRATSLCHSLHRLSFKCSVGDFPSY